MRLRFLAYLLTGKMDEKTSFAEGDLRSVYPRFSAEALKANEALVAQLASLSAANQRHPRRRDGRILILLPPHGGAAFQRLKRRIHPDHAELGGVSFGRSPRVRATH